MIDAHRDFLFHDIYRFAALIEDCVTDHLTFIELQLEDREDLALRLLKPHKLTILHEYIYSMIRTWQSREYRKNSDCYEKEDACRLRLVLEEYGISTTQWPVEPVTSIVNRDANQNGLVEIAQDLDDSEQFYHWFLENEDSFLQYWTQVTDEVFHIVFANRRFLQRFGSALADYMTSELHEESICRALVGSKIKRLSRSPAWLKSAVFHRDHGRCVTCMCDLSGLLSTDRRLHFDHIVPLSRGGSNDPSNFQLLCESCNLKKSHGPAYAGRLYIPWWDY